MSQSHPSAALQVLYSYRSAMLDSTRWQRFSPRDDVIVTTPYKTGTT